MKRDPQRQSSELTKAEMRDWIKQMLADQFPGVPFDEAGFEQSFSQLDRYGQGVIAAEQVQ